MSVVADLREKRWADLVYAGAVTHGYTPERAREKADEFVNSADALLDKTEAFDNIVHEIAARRSDTAESILTAIEAILTDTLAAGGKSQ